VPRLQVRARGLRATALGGAALAGLATGFWSEADVAKLAGTDRVFAPSMDQDQRERLYREWQRAVDRSLGWAS
jgi:glycerol kinase